MAEKILMPKMSDTMEEGVIASWHKKVGDKLESGDLLAEIETDKATMDYEAFEEGVILYLVDEHSTVPVDGLIAIVGDAGEAFEHLLKDGGASPVSTSEAASASPEPAPTASPEPAPVSTSPSPAVAETIVTNAVAVPMPKMSDTMEEGVIAAWHKKVGDPVAAGDLLAEIETDKATMEYESYDEGTLLHIAAQEGESVPVDGLLCVIGEAGADYEAVIRQFNNPGASSSQGEAKSENTPAPANTSASPMSQELALADSSNGRIKISPLARKLAQEKGFDIQQIKGSGDGGRIVKKDIENFVPSTQPTPIEKATPVKEEPSKPSSTGGTPAFGQEGFEEVKLSQMRKTIARRLGESKFSAPHFYLTMEINMDEAISTRKRLNEISPVKISFNDMVIKAAAVALRQHPAVNASWQGDHIRFNHHIHVGMAVAVDEGLLVPVVRFADAKSLSQIATETKDLAGKAKNKKLQPSDWEGNTFSISNLGMFGIEEFTAIINPPDSCILAVGTIKQTGIVKDGELVIGNVMKVTMSCDHRVVDGASGAAFMQTLQELLESPIRMLV